LNKDFASPFFNIISYLSQNSPAVKKGAAPKNAVVKKRCEIQSGGQEMAMMVG